MLYTVVLIASAHHLVNKILGVICLLKVLICASTNSCRSEHNCGSEASGHVAGRLVVLVNLQKVYVVVGLLLTINVNSLLLVTHLLL